MMSGKQTSKKKALSQSSSTEKSSASAVALKPEDRMNLKALKRHDPYVSRILDSASQVALYLFNEAEDAWAKSDVEGTLFAYERSAAPFYGFTISNRKLPEDHWETINSHVEFQQQDPFLLYKNKERIYGIWFYDEVECRRVGSLVTEMTKKVQIEPIREATLTYALSPTQLDSTNARLDSSSSDKHGIMKDILEGQSHGGQESSDIIALLSKAQREYDEVWDDSSCNERRFNGGNNNDGTDTVRDHNDDDIQTKPVSISVSSLFANAKGRRRTQGDLDDDAMTKNDHVLTIDNTLGPPPLVLAPLANGLTKENTAVEQPDALQSFVRKMNINGIQSLDPVTVKGGSCQSIEGNSLIPRPISLSLVKNDLAAGKCPVSARHDSLPSPVDPGVQPSTLFAYLQSAPLISPVEQKGLSADDNNNHRSLKTADVSPSFKEKPRHRNSVPSHSPPACQTLPPIPAHFTASVGSGLATSSSASSFSDSVSVSSPSQSVFGGSHSGTLPLLAPSAFELSPQLVSRELSVSNNRGRKSTGRDSRSSNPVSFYCGSDFEENSTPSSSDGFAAPALSRDQLKLTLLHLLETDDAFVDVIHKGYVKSLRHGRRNPRPK